MIAKKFLKLYYLTTKHVYIQIDGIDQNILNFDLCEKIKFKEIK